MSLATRVTLGLWSCPVTDATLYARRSIAACRAVAAANAGAALMQTAAAAVATSNSQAMVAAAIAALPPITPYPY